MGEGNEGKAIAGIKVRAKHKQTKQLLRALSSSRGPPIKLLVCFGLALAKDSDKGKEWRRIGWQLPMSQGFGRGKRSPPPCRQRGDSPF